MKFLLSFLFVTHLFSAEFSYDQWAFDLQTMINLNKNKTTVKEYILKTYPNDKFQQAILFKAKDIMEQILSLPKNSSLKKHKLLDRRIIQLYSCRDYISYKKGIEPESLNVFKDLILDTEEKTYKYIEHKKMVLEYDIPSDKELKEQRILCDKLYKNFKKE